MTGRERRRLALRWGVHARTRGERRDARGGRILALVSAIGQIADRQAREKADGADGQHHPGIGNQQRKEQHHRDEDWEHHLGRDPLADAFAGKYRQPRYHEERDGERVDERHRGDEHHARHAEEIDVDRQQHGDRAGTPTKKFAAQAGLFGSSAMTLKRARRSPVEIANTMAAIQPALPSSWSPQKYSISAGATPKLTKSPRLSSSAPNRDVPLSMRATRPSMPSSSAAKTMAATAHSSLSSTASRMAVSPAHSASNVIRLGSNVRTGIRRKRGRLPSRRLGSNGENGMARL